LINARSLSQIPRPAMDRKLEGKLAEKSAEKSLFKAADPSERSFADRLGASDRDGRSSDRKSDRQNDHQNDGQKSSAKSQAKETRSSDKNVSSHGSQKDRVRKSSVGSSGDDSTMRSGAKPDVASSRPESSPVYSKPAMNLAAHQDSYDASAEDSSNDSDESGESSVSEMKKPMGKPQMPLPDFFSKAALTTSGSVIANDPTMKANMAGASQAKLNLNGSSVQKSLDALSEMKSEQDETRTQAMQQFMMRMQNEMGIAPEKILQAFSEMPEESMTQPPENSIGEFVSHLDLKPDQEKQATKLYKDMLQTTGQAELSQKLIGLEQGVNFEVLSSKDVSLKKLSDSLDSLNQSFFRKDGLVAEPQKAQRALETMNAEIAKLAQSKNGSEAKSAEAKSNEDKAGLIALGGGSMAAPSMAALEGNEAEAEPAASSATGSSLSSAGGEAASASVLSTLGKSLSAFDGDDSMSDGQGSSRGDSSSSSGGMKMPSQNFASQMKSEMKTAQTGGNEMKAMGKPGMTPVSNDSSLAGAQGQTAAPAPQSAAAAGGPSAMMMGRQPTSKDEQENVRELIKQAQIMLKAGGGEMKLEMRPEGMGQVHLRVAVENGQVNIQMTTENDAAKHILEKGLGDLKSSLASEHLRVEHMKVDVARDAQKQMDHSGQDSQREQARQMAQEFMGSFGEDRQQFREDMFGMDRYRSPGQRSQQNRAKMNPEPIASTSSTKRSDGSKRLDLVA
jgi:flagellar hook-length control protein FliK